MTIVNYFNYFSFQFNFPEAVRKPDSEEQTVKISTYLLKVGQAADCDKLSDYLHANVL